MEEKQHIARKKWVKRFAIVFFVVLLLLTFFSNTIMNHSLPQVATQAIESDSVSSKIRGTGTIESGEAKEVAISESREVEEVLVKAGDTVKKDDVLVKLKGGDSSEITTAQAELDNLKTAYRNSILVNETDQSLVNKAESGKDYYEENRATLAAISAKVKAAQDKVNNIQEQINKLNAASGPTSTDNVAGDGADDMGMDDNSNNSSNPEIDKLNQSLEAAQKELETVTKEHTNYLADINTVNDLRSQYEAIKTAEQNIEKLKQNSVGNEIKSTVDGTILTVDIKNGDTISPDTPFITIQNKDNGYSLTISVTKDQVKKVKIGDEATISNSWYYGDVKATLTTIKNDPAAPGKQKLLVLNIEGDVEAGSTMTVSLGDKSATYDYVVPNSSIREDNNGKFILVVKEKSSPLGNRYVAKRINVEVLVTDDSKSAVKGALEGGEYVITTSSKLIKAGDLIRLAD